MKPLFQKIDCLRIPVTDLEAGLAFYRDRLGHALVWRTDSAAGLGLPGTDAEIVIHTEPEGAETDLLVASADDAAARFAEAGGRIVEPPFELPIGRCTVVEDPWGNRLVLLDTSKGHLLTDPEGTVQRNPDGTPRVRSPHATAPEESA